MRKLRVEGGAPLGGSCPRVWGRRLGRGYSGQRPLQSLGSCLGKKRWGGEMGVEGVRGVAGPWSGCGRERTHFLWPLSPGTGGHCLLTPSYLWPPILIHSPWWINGMCGGGRLGAPQVGLQPSQLWDPSGTCPFSPGVTMLESLLSDPRARAAPAEPRHR